MCLATPIMLAKPPADSWTRDRICAWTVLFVCVAASADAQWLVGGFAGAIATGRSDVRVEQPGSGTSLLFEDVPFRGRSFESPIYYGYRVARVVSKRRGLFVGGEFIHAKAHADTGAAVGRGIRSGTPVEEVPMSAVLERFAMSHGLNFALANLGVRRRLSNRITGILTAGGGAMVPHVESTAGRVARERYELAGVGLQAAAGAELRVWRRTAVFGEYKWTRASLRVSLASGEATLTAASSHLVFGLSAAFGS